MKVLGFACRALEPIANIDIRVFRRTGLHTRKSQSQSRTLRFSIAEHWTPYEEEPIAESNIGVFYRKALDSIRRRANRRVEHWGFQSEISKSQICSSSTCSNQESLLIASTVVATSSPLWLRRWFGELLRNGCVCDVWLESCYCLNT